MYHKEAKYTDADMTYAAKLMTKYGYTIRQAASLIGTSKSTFHRWIKRELIYVNSYLYYQVDAILKKNFAERHIRGGLGNKRRYEQKRVVNI